MEALATIEALGQFAEVLSKTSQVLQFFISLRDAPQEIRTAKDEIASHLTLLQTVQSLVQCDGQNATHFAGLAEPNGPLEQAKKVANELQHLLGVDPSNRGPREGCGALIERLAKLVIEDVTWPLKQEKIREIRRQLETHKASINMSLTAALVRICTNLNQAGTSRADEISNLIRVINEKLSSETIVVRELGILLTPILDIHQDRKRQQEPETCKWVSREEDFRNWLEHNTNPRFICIHGIPGAGKTVLASSIIETTAKKCHSCGYSFYYCLYSRKIDETVPFIRWVLRQLCKQKQNLILPKIEEAYERETPLSVDDLLDCLEQVSLMYDNGVYIIVDAVDESKNREKFLKVLSRIGTDERFRKVSLLITSREEADIMGPIRQLGTSCTCISMSNRNVREDLKRYVHEQLIKIPIFNRLDDAAFLNEVELILTSKANGMFRWAVCQLDVLKRKKDRGGIRNALEKLPSDLFETYERILMDIPPTEQEFARTALALVCSDTAEIPSGEVLTAACLYGVPFGEIGQFTVHSLKESCGSLVSLSELNRPPSTCFNRDQEGPQKFHRCSLAHYTVKEYLFSTTVAKGKAAFFALSDQDVGNIYLKVIFTGLKIVLKSLTPNSPHFLCLPDTHRAIKSILAQFPTWLQLWNWATAPPAHPSTGLLVNLAVLDWKDLASEYLKSDAFHNLSRKEKTRIWTEDFQLKNRERETLLGYCLQELQLNFLRMFVRHGASFEYETEALYTAMKVLQGKNRAYETLEFLLRSGVDPNPTPSTSSPEEGRGFAFTPLQLAVYMLEHEWVELLLEEGADVNMIGTLNGVIPSSFDDPDPESEEARTMQEILQLPTLEICSQAQPTWINKPGTNAESIRRSVKELLKRYGAKEPVEDDVMEVDSETHNRVESETIDLSMISDDSTRL
ncbi:hypothetical protein EKO27_g1241 [Xylaria grammica]|uniref:Nephrocystin 3-like N-terminal domain-containing protein n=1 Tax=Xylaria grammica TaxID=363999 RepID=A0A439DHG0_9PEZI|nr:hypothetical protein EKO27_g1241 [Xylaria grammica]